MPEELFRDKTSFIKIKISDSFEMFSINISKEEVENMKVKRMEQEDIRMQLARSNEENIKRKAGALCGCVCLFVCVVMYLSECFLSVLFVFVFACLMVFLFICMSRWFSINGI